MKSLYLTLAVTPELSGRTVGSLLRRELALPEGFVSHLKFVPGGVTLNGERVRVSVRARVGDVLRARIDDAGGQNPFPPMDCDVRVVWEDDYLAVLCKGADVAIHGGGGTVAAFAALRWGAQQPFHPVNRLDRGTTGLMCAAKCALVHDRLRRAMHTQRFEREYLAVAQGACPEGGTVTEPVDGKSARTDWTRLWTDGSVSLVRARLATGRTHQIRIHMASLGHPLAGDTAYGGEALLSRPALHSARCALDHPIDGRRLCFSEPLPPDLRDFLARRGCDDAFFQFENESSCHTARIVLK